MNDLIIFGMGLAACMILFVLISWILMRRRTALRMIFGGISGVFGFLFALASAFVIYQGKPPEGVIGTVDSPILVSVDSGEEVKLDDFSGKTIVVNVWATWCAPCIEEFPHFERIQEEHGDADKIEVVIVSTEDQKTLEEFHHKFDFELKSYRVDPSASMFKGIQPRPVTLIFNAAGELVESHFGSLNYEKLLNLINLSSL
ncbi:TlpA disulfide reductase family protein [Teredinibacter waterburyi]|uniref:TlpA disulfide reductase family protein n=1 Tax=Teredinibacter waterburyi TaxID=1500538 RepID=UPI00165EE15A|nr:TlpA disulfide reductase family protein [Teredinibacter waterburyi]